MKPKRQSDVLERLEQETRRELRDLEDVLTTRFLNLWFKVRIDLKSIIVREYMASFGRGSWTLPEAQARGVLHRIEMACRERLGHFRFEAATFIRAGLALIYKEEVLRSLWMLDVTTPPSRRPAFPQPRAREAESPLDYESGWDDALGAFLESYLDGLRANLRMEALHEGGLQDASDEVEATRIDGHDPSYKLGGLFANQSIMSEAKAREDVVADNGEIIEEEIWMTMEDAAVCPICDEYDGKPLDEVPDDIPAHFNCRCYSRIVPVEWARMLRSGDPDEKEAALKMDDAGLVQDSMALRGHNGDLIGTAIVRFEDWLNGRAADFYGLNIVGTSGAGAVR